MRANIRQKLYNLRPYSWVDVLLLALVAQVVRVNQVAVTLPLLFASLGLLCLWFFFNLILEWRHRYQYRAPTSPVPAFAFLLVALAAGIYTNPQSVLWVAAGVLLVGAYLLKNQGGIWGVISNLVRGLIQASYCGYALTFFGNSISSKAVGLCLCVGFFTTARSLVGDIRDRRHNAEAGKITLAVRYGESQARGVAGFLLFLTLVVSTIFLSPLAVVPVLGALFILYSENSGYVVHQGTILMSSLFLATLTASLAGQSTLLLTFLSVGISLNLVYYPLLARKSNPIFVG